MDQSATPATQKKPKSFSKMSVGTVAMLILVATFGLSNVVDNLVTMGLSPIFLPELY